MDPVTYQPQSQFGFGFEDQAIFWKRTVLSGLEKLHQASKITVQHNYVNYFDVCCDCNSKSDNTHIYQVQDENLRQIYTLEEFPDCCEKVFCCNLRSLTMFLKDMNGEEILRFKRHFRCIECPFERCYPNQTQVIEIFHQNHLLGSVRERPIGLFQKKHLQVFDNTEEKIYDINGSPCCYTCFDVVFDIKDDAGIPNGTITREWIDSTSNETSRLGRHGPGKIDFPTNIDDKTKALLLAAAMLVNYMYFEEAKLSMQCLYFSLPIGAAWYILPYYCCPK